MDNSLSLYSFMIAAVFCGCSDDSPNLDAAVDGAADIADLDSESTVDSGGVDSGGEDSGSVDSGSDDAAIGDIIVLRTRQAFPSAEGAG